MIIQDPVLVFSTAVAWFALGIGVVHMFSPRR